MRAAPLTRRIVSQIEAEILSGRLGPRERLVEEALSTRFGVSRTPIREVIRILEAKGLVRTEVARGAQVREVSWKEVEDLYAVRGVLESMALELAARNLDPPTVRRIRSRLAAMRAAAIRKDVRAYFEADNDFRALVFGASGNAVLIDLLTSLERRVQRFRLALLSLPRRLAEAQRHHEAVFRALRQGDGRLAGELRRGRIDGSKAVLAEHFDRLEHLGWGAAASRTR